MQDPKKQVATFEENPNELDLYPYPYKGNNLEELFELISPAKQKDNGGK